MTATLIIGAVVFVGVVLAVIWLANHMGDQ